MGKRKRLVVDRRSGSADSCAQFEGEWRQLICRTGRWTVVTQARQQAESNVPPWRCSGNPTFIYGVHEIDSHFCITHNWDRWKGKIHNERRYQSALDQDVGDSKLLKSKVAGVKSAGLIKFSEVALDPMCNGRVLLSNPKAHPQNSET